MQALGDYYHAVELGLSACIREKVLTPLFPSGAGRNSKSAIGATVRVWSVGERVEARLTDTRMKPIGSFTVPSSVKAITPLVEQILLECEKLVGEERLSENASRLAAMQRAENNINELLDDLGKTFHRFRQSGIDEELFDVVSGFDALNG